MFIRWFVRNQKGISSYCDLSTESQKTGFWPAFRLILKHQTRYHIETLYDFSSLNRSTGDQFDHFFRQRYFPVL